jgi:hypothetical protein
VARTASAVAVAVPAANVSSTAAASAATAGLRRHQRQPRSSRLTGRARIGSPAAKRARSSARSAALA